MTEEVLTPVIAAFIVGLVAGAAVERWLIWRRLVDVRWVDARLRWAGCVPDTRKRAAELRQMVAEFTATAVILRIRNPMLMVLWMAHRHRVAFALLALAVIGGATAALFW